MRRRAQPWLGTLVEVTLAQGLADADADAAIATAFERVALVHLLMSFHDAGSDVSRFNRAPAGEVLAVHSLTWQVLKLASEIAEVSGRAFNVACAPNLVAWRLLPAPAVDEPPFVPGVAVYSCEEDGQVRKLGPAWIDLGGIAKGFAVDCAVEALQAAGALAGCVNAGGDLRAFGPLAFPVLVRAPHDPRRFSESLQLRDRAMATSAGYFSRGSVAGRTVSALVDGRDGDAIVDTVSATVSADRCAVADALTKVVLATRDPGHPALAAFGADAMLRRPSPQSHNDA